MAVAQGYGKTVTSGSVFAYDVGDTRNSYRGEPTVNLVPNADTMANWGSYSAGNDGTFITEFGTTGYRVRNKNTWNGIARGITLPAPGTYTISAWFRIWGKSSGNNGINVYTSGGGISDTAQGGDDTKIGEWQRISMTRTYTTTSITFFIISWGGTSGVDWSSWDVTKPQVELKSHATPFITGTRSATQGLLDLTGNSTIDLTNVSFDSNAQMTFDGTDDKAVVANFPHIWDGPVTLETVVSWNDNTRSIIFGNYNVGANDINFEKLTSANLRFYWNRGERDVTTGTNVVTTSGAYHHVVFIRDKNSNSFKFYVDGEIVGTTSNVGTDVTSTGSTFRIGGDSRDGTTIHNGDIPVLKLYNRALTAAEVNQNYRHYKTRFNLS
jgi:hypothetical protein